MATWGAHIRIAEAILGVYSHLHTESFLVGNVGPDCGEPNEDWSVFSPSKAVSHWIDNQDKIQADAFYEQYLTQNISDHKHYSFLLGYYVHLLTDMEWTDMMAVRRDHDPLYQELKTNPSFIWTIKEDWYDLDHLYFKKNPHSAFHKVFKHITAFPDYLDYYPQGGIERQLKYISGFYADYAGNPDRVYTFLVEEEMDRFVREKSEMLIEVLKEKGM
jgi:hypothetical protein